MGMERTNKNSKYSGSFITGDTPGDSWEGELRYEKEGMLVASFEKNP